MKNFFSEAANVILVTCPKRISPYLQKEIADLGLPVISSGEMSVETQGNLSDCIRLNFHLRTGHRVLFLIRKFKARTPDELYSHLKNIEWEELLEPDGYISISSYTNNPAIRDTSFANLKVKDAVVDRMNEKLGRRPDSGPDKHKTVLFLHWKDNEAAIYFDTSGETIAKHGYRKIPMNAPLQESLACAVIMATEWNPDEHFVNPMCGSGTLAIEAALMATDRAPGLLRDNFGFMHIKGFDREAYESIRNAIRRSSKKSARGKIVATDIDPLAIEAARKNAATAGVDHLIEFGVCNFSETPIPEGKGIVIFNPEYGERLGVIEELEQTYEEMGDFLKQKCKGYGGYIFTGNMDLAKKIGLKAARRIEFYNGTIDCRLLKYELYEGTRKIKKDNSSLTKD